MPGYPAHQYPGKVPFPPTQQPLASQPGYMPPHGMRPMGPGPGPSPYPNSTPYVMPGQHYPPTRPPSQSPFSGFNNQVSISVGTGHGVVSWWNGVFFWPVCFKRFQKLLVDWLSENSESSSSLGMQKKDSIVKVCLSGCRLLLFCLFVCFNNVTSYSFLSPCIALLESALCPVQISDDDCSCICQ